MPFRVNLGGEGEVPGVLNQQGRWVVLDSGWRSSRAAQTFEDLVRAGHQFLVCDNTHLPLPDSCCDEVITNSVPIDVATHLGPGVQTSEVQRILKPGGLWTHDNTLRWVKP
jgi:ubiquinone/menaquinone biosynthesis C-methylase UbiE